MQKEHLLDNLKDSKTLYSAGREVSHSRFFTMAISKIHSGFPV